MLPGGALVRNGDTPQSKSGWFREVVNGFFISPSPWARGSKEGRRPSLRGHKRGSQVNPDYPLRWTVVR
jgi:hypothetical protein